MPQCLINDILDRYVKEKLPLRRKGTQASYRSQIPLLREHFGTKPARELTPEDCKSFMDVDKGRTTRIRCLAVLSSALTAGVKWRMVEYNVLREVERPKSASRKRIVNDREITALKRIAAERVCLAIDIARLTGLRQTSITQLRWTQVHERERRILARHYLTDKQIEIGISPELQAVLDKCRQLKVKEKSEFVLPTQSGAPYTSTGFRTLWQRTISEFTRAGHNHFTFNDITMTALVERKRLSESATPEDPTVAGFSEFDAVVRTEATRMAQHYKVFYCLEKSIRMLITEAMLATYGTDWWRTKIDPVIKQKADQVLAMEIDSGLPQRSDAMIDYTTFGQLRQIISQNWTDVFAKKLRTEKAVSNVMTSLNRIRGSIAHFSPMSDQDVNRLQFTVSEWFSLLLS